MIFIAEKKKVNPHTKIFGVGIKIIASITLIFLFGFFWIFDLAAIPLDEKIFLAHQVVKIKEGANLSEIAGIFKEKNLVKSSLIFNLIVRILGGEKKIKAGSYLFEEPFSAFEIAEKIISGDYGIEYRKILIKEGATVEEIGKIFEEEGFFKKEEFFKIAGCCAGNQTSDFRYPMSEIEKFDLQISNFPARLRMDEVQAGGRILTLEGFLFPDTYFFPKNISAEEAVKIILQNFNKKTDSVFRKTAADKEVYDILIMASILEKEARVYETRQTIAGILWKRLEDGMPLQVDAPFQYYKGKNSYTLTKEDLAEDHEYNTYTNKGLPPTAITNPGIDSLRAAIAPTQTNYLYFLSDKHGNMYYAKDFEGHKRNRELYLN